VQQGLRYFEDPVMIDLKMGTVPTEVLAINIDSLFANVPVLVFVSAVLANVI
jgi:hypothetical protein